MSSPSEHQSRDQRKSTRLPVRADSLAASKISITITLLSFGFYCPQISMMSNYFGGPTFAGARVKRRRSTHRITGAIPRKSSGLSVM
jgi:hypothetical protein